MRSRSQIVFFALLLLLPALASAQLAVTVSAVKVAGTKAVVPLSITNDFTEKIESARAACFLLDEQGKMVGQATKWVIGGTKDRSPLPARHGTTFNFVVPLLKAGSTNLQAKVTFTRVILEDGKLADVAKDITVKPALK